MAAPVVLAPPPWEALDRGVSLHGLQARLRGTPATIGPAHRGQLGTRSFPDAVRVACAYGGPDDTRLAGPAGSSAQVHDNRR